MKHVIIFDLDGTLVDSNATCVEILQAMLNDRGSTHLIDKAASAVYMSLGGERMVRALLGEACCEADKDLAEFRARYAVHTTPREALFDGVAEGLERLFGAGFDLAICSNKPANLCAKLLGDTGIDHLFSAVVGTTPDLKPKPTSDLLDATLLRLGKEARHCYFVGDSDLDHLVADAADIPFCFMTYGYAEPGWAPPNGKSFARFGELVDHFLAIGPARRG